MTVALLVGSAAPASAHAYLERTNPADGSVVARAPERLALYFSEHVVLEATTIDLVDGHGRVIHLDDLQLETDEPDDTEVPSVVTAVLPDLARDAYRVRWSTLSSDDLHRTSGFFVFGVGTEVQATGFSEPNPRPSESGLRWLLLLGLALVLGSELVGRLAPVPTARRRRLRAAGRAGAVAALVGSVALLLDQVLAGGLSWEQLGRSGYALRWGLRETGLLLVVLALWWLRDVRTRVRSLVLAAGAVTAAVGTALLGHAGADTGAGSTRVVATAVHLLAMLSWVGGVACLALLLGPRSLRNDGDRDLRRLLHAFGGPAAACLGLGVATGLYLASSVVVSVDAALVTTYGRTLLLKVGLVVVMVLVAVVNHRRLRGRHDLDLPRRGVLGEATIAVAVLGATAVLTSAQPATESVFLTPPAATTGPLSGEAADLHVALDVAPNRPGVNVVSIDVFDTRRPAPSQVTGVELRVDGTTLPAVALGDGRWTVADLELTTGRRTLTVSVERPGLEQAELRVPWTIGAGAGTHRTVVSTTSLRTPLRGLAAIALVPWLLILLRTPRPGSWRQRRSRPRVSSPRRSSPPSGGPRPRTGASLRDRSPVP
jgi:copper transport protein